MEISVVLRLYVHDGIPCDRVVSNPEWLGLFTARYNQATGESVSPAEMGHYLLNMRRRGQANGGLPRLCRTYRGRSCSEGKSSRW